MFLLQGNTTKKNTANNEIRIALLIGNAKYDGGDDLKNPINDANMLFIKGGTFLMGSPESEVDRENDEKQHSVTVSSFYMSKYEVTVEEYEKYCIATNTKMPDAPSFNPNWKNKHHPIVNVSWEDAVAYCAWLSKTTGKKYRLPTEAEWEYACRVGTTTPFSTGANLTTSQGNYHGDYPYNGNAKGEYRKGTTEVGSFSPNAWGLYDMHGNVYEWCQDLYPNSTNRVLRGGCWRFYARNCRSANRYFYAPTSRTHNIGFRLSQ